MTGRIVLSMFAALFVSTAQADFSGRDHVELKLIVAELAMTQPEFPENKVLFVRSSAAQNQVGAYPGIDTLDARLAEMLPYLERIAVDQANVWADTILEGDFDADGETVIDQIEAIYKDGKLSAYRITYSERAWRTGANGQRLEEGRIVESTFVSPSLDSWFRDDTAYANFTRL